MLTSEKVIFITGVSTGIGRKTAEYYLQNNYRVIGTYRDKKSIQDFLDNSNFIGIQFDFILDKNYSFLVDSLVHQGIQHIDVLVNNAGVAIAGAFEYQNFDDIEMMIQVNVLAVMKTTQVLLPHLKKSPDATIINISSVSGVNGTPFLAAYCASKHAIEGFSESLRRELKIYPIKVVVIGPGSVKTPIWKKGFQNLQKKYSSTEYQAAFDRFISVATFEENNGLDANVIVQDIKKAIDLQSPAVRYSPVPKPFENYILSLLPKKLADYLTCRFLHLVSRRH